MTRTFSTPFIAALIGMSIITHAHAGDVKEITPELIENMYMAEFKVPGATVECFQGGKKVLIEMGLRDLSITDHGMNALRLDGSRFTLTTFPNNSDVFCTVINRPDPANDE